MVKMEKLLSLVLINLLLIWVKAHTSIILSVDTHVKRFGNLRLNCTSNTVPIGKTANIQINGKSFTAITILNGECFSSVLDKQTCTPDMCSCSKRGLWFSHVYTVVQMVGMLDITCSMIMEMQGEISDSTKVKIIDFKGPKITTKPGLPFPAGMIAMFTCEVDTSSQNISFKWECLGNKGKHGTVSMFNSTKYSSVITHNMHLQHDGKTCRCCTSVDGITAKSEISVSISRKPIIDINKPATCYSSTLVTMYCIILTEFPLFGFNYWIHSRNGTQIRTLHGYKLHTKSVLTIDSCSHDDSGNYTCVAYNRNGDEITYGNKTVSLLVHGPPIIQSAEIVTCNSSSVTLTCVIKTGLPLYGFNQWRHFFNGKFIRTLNGSVDDMESVLEVETCSYQNAGEYICTAWNEYGGSMLVANKNISFIVYASPVVISSDVIRERHTTLSATFYSTTETNHVWQKSNETIANSTDRKQTFDRNEIELIVHNKSIECDGYIANLSMRSTMVGEYVLILRNAFGETRLVFNIDNISTPAFTASFDLSVVVFGVVTLGIFILTATGAVIMMSKGIQRNNVIHIIGPHERCPTIPIYHSAPALDTPPHVYDTPEIGYMQAINDQYELDQVQDTEIKDEEYHYSNNSSSNYDEIDI